MALGSLPAANFRLRASAATGRLAVLVSKLDISIHYLSQRTIDMSDMAAALRAERPFQKFEANPHRGDTHGVAADVAEPLFARDGRRTAAGASEMDKADRLR